MFNSIEDNSYFFGFVISYWNVAVVWNGNVFLIPIFFADIAAVHQKRYYIVANWRPRLW